MGIFDGIPGQTKQGIAAVGLGLSQLAAGRPVNLSPAHEALMKRQAVAERQRWLQESGILNQFSPEQRAILAQMPPGAAMQVIAGQAFRAPAAPTRWETITDPSDGSKWQVNPLTGEKRPLTGPGPSPERRTAKGADGFLYYVDDGTRVFPNAKAPQKETAVLVGPDDARRQAWGIPADDKTYEVTIDPATGMPTDFSVPGSGNVFNIGGQGALTPGQEALDKAYAPDYMAWISGGGADATARAASIKSVLDRLAAGEKLTGPEIAIAGDFVRAFTNPGAQDAKDLVEGVVQRSLKEILGAQFTEKEGERLVERAYNVKLGPEENMARLNAFYTLLMSAAEAQNAMATYFQENGTLAGLAPVRIPTVDDFIAAMDQAAPVGPDEEALRNDERNWMMGYD